MRDRLIELLNDSFAEQYEKRCLLTAQHTADHLLAAGVIVPPCKVGDPLYKNITTSKGIPAVREIVVTGMSILLDVEGVNLDSYVFGHIKGTECGESVTFAGFGKTVFLAREEAERALAERREG